MNRRLRYVPITAALWMDLLKKHQPHVSVELVDNALPADARLVRYGADAFGYINLIVESIDFDEVIDGDDIPRHPTPTFRRVYQE